MRHYLIPAALISLASAVFAAVGLIEPARLGWPAPGPWWVTTALVMLLCLPIAWLLAFRLHLRSLWIVRNETTVDMQVQLVVEEASDSTSHYACLRDSADAAVLRRVPVYPPPGDLEPLREPQPAKVYMDRVSGKPVGIEVRGRRLWAMVQEPNDN